MIRFREAKLEAGWLMVRPMREDLGSAMAFIRKMKDRVYAVEPKEHRQKRSLDANAYFVYGYPDGRTVVEDTKGVRTADYIIKRKLMLHVHGIRILET